MISVETLGPIVRVAARKVERKTGGKVAARDAEQDIWVRILEDSQHYVGDVALANAAIHRFLVGKVARVASQGTWGRTSTTDDMEPMSEGMDPFLTAEGVMEEKEKIELAKEIIDGMEALASRRGWRPGVLLAVKDHLLFGVSATTARELHGCGEYEFRKALGQAKDWGARKAAAYGYMAGQS